MEENIKLGVSRNSSRSRIYQQTREKLITNVSSLGFDEELTISSSDNHILKDHYKSSYPILPVNEIGYFVVIGPIGKPKVYCVMYAADWFEIKNVSEDKNGKCTVSINLRENTVELPCEIFMPSKVCELTGYGIYLNTAHTKEISAGFRKMLRSYKITRENRIIGFSMENKGKASFDAYSKDNPILKCSDGTDQDTYIKNLNNLITNMGVMFALACACASMFLAYLRLFCNVPLSSFVISFVGKTSTGKSTVQTLMASVYTNPADEKVMRSFYGTENALIKLLDNKMGVPMIFDETTITGKTDIGRMIYAISLGRGKARCTTNADLRQSGEWYTIVSTSSEASNLSTQTMHNGGLDSRNLGFEDISFTDSAEHAEAIKSFSCECYGILGKRISDYLVNEEPDKIRCEYDKCKHELSDAIGLETFTGISERLIANYALIIQSGKVLKEFGVNINIESLVEIVVENHVQISEKNNIAEKCYKHIVDYIATNPFSPYIIKDTTLPDTIAIVSSQFERILNDFGVTNIKLALNSMEDAGYLIRGKGRKLTSAEKKKGMKSNTSQKARRRVNGVLTDCYLIKLPVENEESYDESESVATDTEYCLENYEEVTEL